MTQLSFDNEGSEIDRFYNYLVSLGVKLSIKNDDDPENILLNASGAIDNLTPRIKELMKKYKPGLIAKLSGDRVNDFSSSLEKGNSSIHHNLFDLVYQHAFYNIDFIKRTKSGDTIAQKSGSDVVIYLTSDRLIRIDEKRRFKDYPDIALEYISNDRFSTPGWMEKDLGIDYLCYAFVKSKKVYLFPWQKLKLVWNLHKRQWIRLGEEKRDGFFKTVAPNPTYNTISCAVPIDKLLKLVQDVLVFQVTDQGVISLDK